MDKLSLSDYRCSCGKLLFKGVFFEGLTEIKCRYCRKINKIGHIEIEDDKTHYLLIVDDKGIFTNVSDSACMILGYTKAEIVGKCFGMIHPDSLKCFDDKAFRLISGLTEDSYLHIDTFHRHKEGKLIPVLVLMKLCKIDETKKGLVIISKVKKEETDEKKIEEDNSRFINKACDFYFETDKSGKGTYFSPSMEKIFKLSCPPLIGSEYFDILPTRQKVEAIKDFLFFSLREDPFRVRNNTVEVSGSVINYDAYFVPNFNDFGKFIGYKVFGWVENQSKNNITNK